MLVLLALSLLVGDEFSRMRRRPVLRRVYGEIPNEVRLRRGAAELLGQPVKDRGQELVGLRMPAQRRAPYGDQVERHVAVATSRRTRRGDAPERICRSAVDHELRRAVHHLHARRDLAVKATGGFLRIRGRMRLGRILLPGLEVLRHHLRPWILVQRSDGERRRAERAYGSEHRFYVTEHLSCRHELALFPFTFISNTASASRAILYFIETHYTIRQLQNPSCFRYWELRRFGGWKKTSKSLNNSEPPRSESNERASR